MRFVFFYFIITFSFCQFHIDGVVAIVGNHSILKSEVLEQASLMAQQKNISPEKSPYQFQEVFDSVLKEKIHRYIILNVAEKDTSISVSFEEINAELDSRVDMFVQSFGSVEALEQKMELSVKELKQEYWETIEEELLVEKYKYVLFGNLSITSNEVLDFYYTYKDSFPPSPSLFSGSIIEKPIRLSSLSKDSIFSLALSIKDSLDLNLLDFESAAKKYSQDPGSAPLGGDLGFSKRGSFVSAFEKTAFSLNDGEIGDITETPFGYHIIKLEKKLGEKIKTKHILFSLNPSKKDIQSIKKELNNLSLLVDKDPGLMDSLAMESFLLNKNLSGKYSDHEMIDFPPLIVEEIESLSDYSLSPVFINENSLFLVFKRFIIKGNEITPENSWMNLELAAINDKRSREFQLWIDEKLNETYVKILDF